MIERFTEEDYIKSFKDQYGLSGNRPNSTLNGNKPALERLAMVNGTLVMYGYQEVDEAKLHDIQDLFDKIPEKLKIKDLEDRLSPEKLPQFVIRSNGHQKV